MSVGSDGVAVLVVAASRARARDLAAGIEAQSEDIGAATATGVDDAVERLERTAVDGVVVSTDGFEEDGVGVVAELETAADGPVLVEAVDEDLSRKAVIAAGAADAVDELATDEDLAVFANRLELAVTASRAERTMAETQHRYHRLLEASPAAIVIFDEEGSIMYANPAAADLVGADDPYEVEGRSVFEFVTPDAREGTREWFERVIADREPVDAREHGLLGLDGETRHVESAGSPVTIDGEPGGQAVLADVTDLKERERRLRTERDRFTALFESLPEPAVHVRFEDGEPIVRNVNTSFLNGFGYEADEVVGESLNEFVVPEGLEDEATEIDRSIEDGELVEREVRRSTADGEREFLFTAKPVETAAGVDEGVGIYVDVTERSRREEALARQNERLDAFASIVSHDLKSPLSIAKGNVHLAREDGRAADAGGDEIDYLEDAETALDRMEQIIDDLLRLARQGEQGVHREPVDGSAVVAEAWTEVPSEGSELENEWDRRVLADRSQLRELLGNLLRNAVEHSSTSPRSHAREDAVGREASDEPSGAAPEDAVEHGSTSPRPADDVRDTERDGVTVEVGPLEEHAGTRESQDAPEHGASGGFYVADDGPGIPADERERVFEPGYTTSDDGTGFGLVVVDEIARAHGWTVSVTESEMGGARFEFRGVELADGE